MNDLVICVESLGKRYHIGSHANYNRLSEVLQGTISSVFRASGNVDSGESESSIQSEFWALKEISFEIRRGEVFAIIGRNGAGKSTLLKILSRITEPTVGRFGLKGRVASLLEVGTGFHNELTGRENIFLSGTLLGMSRAQIRRQFESIVEFSGVSRFIDTPVKRYSSGMQVRLGFAVAAHLDSEILIVDEILAVGDADFQTKSVQKMSEIGRSGRTVLFVSHNMSAVQRLCQSGILLSEGRVTRIGPIDELLAEYLSKGGRLVCQRAWSSPLGNDIARLLHAVIKNTMGEACSTIEIDQSFSIEITHENLNPEFSTTAVIHVFNEQGVCIFSSHDYNNHEWWQTPRRKGIVISRCEIPAHFMTEGCFTVLVAITSYGPDMIHAIENDALCFEVVDHTRGRGVRGPFEGQWPGVVRPWLHWDVEQQSS